MAMKLLYKPFRIVFGILAGILSKKILEGVWGVFDNENKCVATYEYPRRGDADDHAARLTSDKKNTHFVQPVKEPIEEKKEK